MLNDFSWNMTGYIPKYQVNPHGGGIISYVAERIFQLEPEPPAVDSLNEYILSALQEKNLIYFSFFLHHYELHRSAYFYAHENGLTLNELMSRSLKNYLDEKNIHVQA